MAPSFQSPIPDPSPGALPLRLPARRETVWHRLGLCLLVLLGPPLCLGLPVLGLAVARTGLLGVPMVLLLVYSLMAYIVTFASFEGGAERADYRAARRWSTRKRVLVGAYGPLFWAWRFAVTAGGWIVGLGRWLAHGDEGNR